MLIAVLVFATYNINSIFCHDLASYISEQSNKRHIKPVGSNLLFKPVQLAFSSLSTCTGFLGQNRAYLEETFLTGAFCPGFRPRPSFFAISLRCSEYAGAVIGYDFGRLYRALYSSGVNPCVERCRVRVR